MASRFSFDDMGMMAEPEQAVSIYDESRPVDILQGRGGAIGQFQFTPGSQYNLSIGGQFVGTANTEDEYRRLVQMAQQELDRSGKKAQVTFEDSRLRAAGFPQFHVEPKQTNPVIDMVLPIAASLLIPGSGPLLAAAKAAGGSLASSVLQGRAVDDALLRAAISGGTAFGVGQIPGLDSLGVAKAGALASGKTAGLGEAAAQQVASGAAGSAATGAADPIMTVVADRIVGGGLGSAAAGAISGGIGSIGADLVQPSAFDQAMELARMQNQYSVPMPGDDALITTIGQRIPQSTIGGSVPGFAGGAASTLLPDLTQFITNPPAQQPDYGTEEPEAVGTAPRVPKPIIPPAAIAVPAAAAATAALASSTGAPTNLLDQLADPSAYSGQETVAKSTSGKSGAAKAIQTANTIKGGIALAAGLGNALGLFGGGGSGSSGAGGIGGLGGGFNDLVAVQPFNRTRNPATFDPFTYGQYGGQFRFFGDERPQFQIGIGAPTVPGPNAGIAPQPEVPIQVKRGGPIRGIGGGQDDKIPAMLSDGEYVFSAQDVADLGDGSNDEGARRLDEMRKLIRKQAGRRNTKTIAKPQKSVSSLLRAAR
jgi:hypothetical protein